MPPKIPRDDSKRKLEIASKVKQMRDRQQKWMNEKKEIEEGGGGGKVEQSYPPRHQISVKQDHTLSSSRNQEFRKTQHMTTPSRSSVAYQPSNYGTPDDAASVSDDYNLIADNIIHRVKHNLGVTPDSYTDGGETQKPPLTAHLCYKCQQLMVGPHHIPMMLIPCGHNVCEACCRDAISCYLCNSEISGHTYNAMLQQIISNLHSNVESSRRSRQFQTQSKLGRQQSEEQREVQTLLLRREAMEEEKLNIETTIDKIKERISGEVTQISNIERKEAEIIHQIAHLQKQIVSLQDHKQDFKEKITSHRSDILSQNRKLELIDETMEYLRSRLETLNHTANG